MIRSELHHVRRPFFDCTGARRLPQHAMSVPSDDLHLHAEITRPLPRQTIRYSDIRVALRLMA